MARAISNHAKLRLKERKSRYGSLTGCLVQRCAAAANAPIRLHVPQVLLGRPSEADLKAQNRSLEPHEGGRDHHLTLAQILLAKAEEGVQVRVMIFRELAISLPNDSAHAAEQLAKHKNIRVLRHDQGSEVLWSHHEKVRTNSVPDLHGL